MSIIYSYANDFINGIKEKFVKKVFHIRLSSDLGGIETHILKISTYVDRTKYHFNILIYDNQKPCFYDALSALGGDFFSITSRKKYICRNTKELKIAY